VSLSPFSLCCHAHQKIVISAYGQILTNDYSLFTDVPNYSFYIRSTDPGNFPGAHYIGDYAGALAPGGRDPTDAYIIKNSDGFSPRNYAAVNNAGNYACYAAVKFWGFFCSPKEAFKRVASYPDYAQRLGQYYQRNPLLLQPEPVPPAQRRSTTGRPIAKFAASELGSEVNLPPEYEAGGCYPIRTTNWTVCY
jgi:hypothetical protein